MDHYVEIRLRPDPEFAGTLLMSALFSKLHRALVTAGHGEVGISFPYANKTLGDTLRLHGTHSAVQRIMALNWLQGMKDLASVSAVLPVPENCRYRIVRRHQVKSSLERMYRRSVKKGKITQEEAEHKIAKGREKMSKCPFVQLASLTSGQRFRLFIKQEKTLKTPQQGTFSNYGLSNDASVPWF